MSSNHFKTVLQDFFKQQKICDVTFSCSDPESSESTIMAHKFVLSVASDVFYTMFNGETAKQAKDDEKLNKVNIDDIKMPTFKLFLR